MDFNNKRDCEAFLYECGAKPKEELKELYNLE